MTLTSEQLVPTLETCRALKEAGWVKETYFRYVYGSFPDKWFLYTLNSRSSKEIAIPAPTLQELLGEIALVEYREVELERVGKWWCACAWGIDRKKYHEQSHSNPAEAASLLWLELRKEGE